MKSEFKARPVYLQRDDRIKAHFTTCFISLLIYRMLERKLSGDYTCDEIVSGLRDMNFYEINGEGYVPTYTKTDFTDDLHDKFGFRTDYQIVNMKQLKKFLMIRKSKKVLTFLKHNKSLYPFYTKGYKLFIFRNCQRRDYSSNGKIIQEKERKAGEKWIFQLTRLFRSVGLSKVKLSRAHAHNFRHLYCLRLAEEGLTIDEIADLAGHTNINTTRIYTRKTKQDLINVIRKL